LIEENTGKLKFNYIRTMSETNLASPALVAEKLLAIQAIRMSVKEPYTWASGWKSPVYCDNRKVLSFPNIRNFIKDQLCNTITTHFTGSALLAGVATAGIPWGALASDQLSMPFIYVRPKPKEHGLGNQIEGYFEKGQSVLVIEDLISTGKSSLQVVEVLQKAGLDVRGMISIFEYGFESAKKSFENAGIRYKSLTNYETLIALAIQKGMVSPDQEAILLKWKEDPANWKGV
jgi:orotate phosphoribosyltransferase